MNMVSNTAPPSGLLAALTLRRVTIALALAVVVAAVLNPIFVTPFVVLLGRTMVIAMVLLLVFIGAGQWRQSWAPSWVVQLIGVALAVPITTFAVYLPSVGGDVTAVLSHEGRLS